MNPPMNWVPVILVCWVLACFVFVVWFCVLFGFVLCVFAVCLVYDDDGPMDYVQVPPQFSFAALNSRGPGIQGRPQLRLQKSYQFQVPKTNPKTSPLYLLVSIMTIFPFLLC